MELIALSTCIVWPVIPLFWIPVHCNPNFFKRLGFFTYLLPFVTWLPLAYFLYHERDLLLRYAVDFILVVKIVGGLLLAAGLSLQIWTLALLSLPGIMGMPEVTSTVKGRLVTGGPFSLVRHPTYLSHTMMLLGVFLMTGVAAVGVLTLIDSILIGRVVIPLEERELLIRFGNAYEQYRKRVRSKFFPW
jgi:protein-S-isoprenylcysteine O-methyltransferase Ste14